MEADNNRSRPASLDGWVATMANCDTESRGLQVELCPSCRLPTRPPIGLQGGDRGQFFSFSLAGGPVTTRTGDTGWSCDMGTGQGRGSAMSVTLVGDTWDHVAISRTGAGPGTASAPS